MSTVQELFLEWMLDSLVDRSVRRQRPEVQRMGRLARLEESVDFDRWFEPLREQALARFTQADWLVFDWLRQPGYLAHFLAHLKAPFGTYNRATTKVWLLTAWAARHPPQGSVREMAEVLSTFLSCDPRLQSLYQGSGGLLALVKRLDEQSSPADRKWLGQSFLQVLSAPWFDAGPELRRLVGQRLLSTLLPALDDLPPERLELLKGRFDLPRRASPPEEELLESLLAQLA